MVTNLVAVITAAGASTRMDGFPKPLLTFDGDRFIDRLVATYTATPVAEIVVVLGHEAQEITARATLEAATVIENADYESGMLSSVQCGVEHAADSDAAGILLNPVDCPLITPDIVETMIEAWQSTDDVDVVVPAQDGGRGHPPIFTATTFDALLDGPDSGGARAIVRDDDTTTREVDIADDRIFVDIDTPGEYWSAIKRYEPT